MNGLQIVAALGLLLGLLTLGVTLFRSSHDSTRSSPTPDQPEVDGGFVRVDGLMLNANSARDKVLIMIDGRALWPEIRRTLNPNDDVALDEMLLALRGPDIDPVTALTILNDELKIVLKTNPSAVLRDALRRIKPDMASEYHSRIGN